MALLANYHTHTPRCKHASDSEEDYVRTALAQGYDILGFSDHTPWPFPDYVSFCRMTEQQLPDYVAAVREMQKKYENRLKIYLGLEAEYAPDYIHWLRDVKAEYQLDYLVFGNHFHTSEEKRIYFGDRRVALQYLEDYVEHAILAMETGLFSCFAHPDLFLNHYPLPPDAKAEKAMRRLCEAAVKYNIPMEYNLLGESRRAEEGREANGECGYTYPGFWRIAAEYPIHAIVGCDAHKPAELEKAVRQKQVQQMLRGMGIHVLDTLPGLD